MLASLTNDNAAHIKVCIGLMLSSSKPIDVLTSLRHSLLHTWTTMCLSHGSATSQPLLNQTHRFLTHPPGRFQSDSPRWLSLMWYNRRTRNQPGTHSRQLVPVISLLQHLCASFRGWTHGKRRSSSVNWVGWSERQQAFIVFQEILPLLMSQRDFQARKSNYVGMNRCI